MEWIHIRNFLYPDKTNVHTFFRHGNHFYDRYLNLVEKNYIDDDGYGEKPKLKFQRRLLKYSRCDPIRAIFDRNRKKARQNFGKK